MKKWKPCKLVEDENPMHIEHISDSAELNTTFFIPWLISLKNSGNIIESCMPPYMSVIFVNNSNQTLPVHIVDVGTRSSPCI